VNALVLLKTSDGGFWSVRGAATLARRGHRVTFLLPSLEGPLPDKVRAAGLEVVRAEAPLPGAPAWRQPGAIRRLRRQVRSMDADVVVSHLYAAALAGRAATWRSGIPHVFMSPGPLYLENPVIHGVERVACRLDAHVIATSDVLDDAYRELGLPDDRRSKIAYSIGAGWAEVTTPAQRAAARAALDLGPDEFVAVCVACFYAPKRLVHRGKGIKGHDVLLEAWRRHRDAGGEGTLLIVGDGFGPAGIAHRRDLLDRFGDVEGVRWVGHADDVGPWYQAADVSIAPSRSENHGAAAEASLLAIPTIAARVGGLPELVIEGETGWVVPPDDPAALVAALQRSIAAGPEERRARGLQASELAIARFAPANSDEPFADVVEEVVRGRHRRHHE
jgi:glycosyltransferase involved in cell wall biosynthesis